MIPLHRIHTEYTGRSTNSIKTENKNYTLSDPKPIATLEITLAPADTHTPTEIQTITKAIPENIQKTAEKEGYELGFLLRPRNPKIGRETDFINSNQAQATHLYLYKVEKTKPQNVLSGKKITPQE